MKNIQQIRRSQIVLIYGPGSIIESKRGPRLIPAIKHGLKSNLFQPNVFSENEIIDCRLSLALKQIIGKLKGGETYPKVFALPTNAALNIPSYNYLYSTYKFPIWRVCHNISDKSHDNNYILFRDTKCPKCSNKEDPSPIRFILACNRGHLDDINWSYAVHSNGTKCTKSKSAKEFFYWHTRGSSLSSILIECPYCHSTIDMKSIYDLRFSCTSRFPEREYQKHKIALQKSRSHRSSCDYPMKVVQRQSTSLYVAETFRLLTIPKYDNKLSNLLQLDRVKASIDGILLSNPDICSGTFHMRNFIEILKKVLKAQHLSDDTSAIIIEYVEEHGVPEFCEFFNDLHGQDKKLFDYIGEEFVSLSSGPRTESEYFQIGSEVIYPATKYLPKLKLSPVNKLRTITAQIGYRRTPYNKQKYPDEIVLTCAKFVGDNIQWHLGFEGFGEGIFITFEDDLPEINSETEKSWNLIDNRYNLESQSQNMQSLSECWQSMVNPLFVWLHTLSHAIILALSLHAGYSSSALQERIYISEDRKTGGILIYTTSAGEDGSMGGLVGLVNEFDTILNIAINRILFCSNDPLCYEISKSKESLNGSACHSCLLISETSCEHQNKWLDRHTFI